jgi:hypothetical protein
VRQSVGAVHGFKQAEMLETTWHTSPVAHGVEVQSEEQYPPENGRQKPDAQSPFEPQGSPVGAPDIMIGFPPQPAKQTRANPAAQRISEAYPFRRLVRQAQSM